MIRTCLVLIAIAVLASGPSLAQRTTCASVSSSGAQGNGDSGVGTGTGFGNGVSISADGRYVAFQSSASNLVHDDTNGTWDVFVHDRRSSTTTRVSVDSSGAQGNGASYSPSISAHGRYVAFHSLSNLVPGDTNGADDVFVHDRTNSTTTRVSVDSSGAQGNGASYSPSISADGRYVAFYSIASNLVPGDTNGTWDVFVHDTVSGVTTRVSVDSNGVQGNDYSGATPSITADGRYVAFWSLATNLVSGDTNGYGDVFVHDRLSSTTTRVSVDSNGVQGDLNSTTPSISSDGRYVAFQSYATNLAPGDTNPGFSDVFVHDRESGATTCVSVSSSGTHGDNISYDPSISPDGRFVSFWSDATNLVLGDTNSVSDVFVHDTVNHATTRVSVNTSGAEGTLNSYSPSISADGRDVAFASEAYNLVPGDSSSNYDVFVRDRGPASAFLSLCFGDGSGGVCPCFNWGSVGHGCENSAATGGAELSSSGSASFSSDTVLLHSAGELPNALSIVLQVGSLVAPVAFGDGLLCAGGSLKRMYVKQATGGAITAPEPGDRAISVRSATLGEAIPLGATRVYQVYYHDSNLGFCPGGFNATNAIAIAWGA